MRTQVYSWRLSADVKAALEREARARKLHVSSILDMAVREWLDKNGNDVSTEEAQRRLHAAAAKCFGVVASGEPSRVERAREIIRDRLQKRHAG